ncbi:MAG TPA: hypothetical protein VMW69_00980 [Spirochaetia bacterium]|nr:hypothetical protein [Spirochaetia bacterium]
MRKQYFVSMLLTCGALILLLAGCAQILSILGVNPDFTVSKPAVPTGLLATAPANTNDTIDVTWSAS